MIGIVDSGIDASHQEFAPGQVVAWRDFSPSASPTPVDTYGHGTMVASMAAGLNADPVKTPSACPGCPLAVARVTDTSTPNLLTEGRAIDWLVAAGADVINMSIGTVLPSPYAFADRVAGGVYAAIDRAAAAGVLVVVLNGNGFLYMGLGGYPGYVADYGSSTNALAVGASGTDGLQVTTDPEVVAVYGVTAAAAGTTNGYVGTAGTSFSSPYVAGFAATLLAAAREAGQPLDRDALEVLVKFSARPTELPPNIEGYGVIDGQQLAAAVAHARAGTTPSRPSPDVDALYVEAVAGTLRGAWSGTRY